jgi:hypothetical protein
MFEIFKKTYMCSILPNECVNIIKKFFIIKNINIVCIICKNKVFVSDYIDGLGYLCISCDNY